MSLRSRYGLVLLVLMGYYASFFVPLFSLTTSSPQPDAGVVPGMEFLQGIALFDYHYLSVGIFPFIFASLALQFARWQIPQFIGRFTSENGGMDGLQRALTYLFGVVFSAVIILEIPDERYVFHPSLTFLELMLSLYFLEQLVNWLKLLKISSSPVMVFLGLNVLSGMVYSWYEYLSISYAPVGNVFLLSILTGLVSLLAMKWCTVVTSKRVVNTRGNMLVKQLRLPVMKAGVTPVIYSFFAIFPILTVFFDIKDPILFIGKTPLVWLLFFVLFYLFSYRLSVFQLQIEDMSKYASQYGIFFEFGGRRFTSFSDILDMICRESAIKSAVVLLLLVVIQSFYKVNLDDSGVNLQTVGGIGFILIFNVIKDFNKQFKAHRLWSNV